VKSDYPGTPDTFASAVATCPRPVIIEESPLPVTPQGTLQTVDGVLRACGAGVMFANRIWDAPDPRALAEAVAGMVHHGWDIERAQAHATHAPPR
jgi:fructose-bisphosphate aldolase/2-amino-3,7-dideoxy-D-threo-hept-6-ulosonate synthase